MGFFYPYYIFLVDRGKITRKKQEFNMSMSKYTTGRKSFLKGENYNVK